MWMYVPTQILCTTCTQKAMGARRGPYIPKPGLQALVSQGGAVTLCRSSDLHKASASSQTPTAQCLQPLPPFSESSIATETEGHFQLWYKQILGAKMKGNIIWSKKKTWKATVHKTQCRKTGKCSKEGHVNSRSTCRNDKQAKRYPAHTYLADSMGGVGWSCLNPSCHFF